MSLLITFALFVIGLVFLCVRAKFQNEKYKNQAPSIPPWPVIGNLWTCGILNGQNTFTQTLYDLQKRFGDTFLFWFGSNPMITFCSVEAAQQIFSDRQTFDQSPLFLPNFDLLCPHAIFMPTGPKWKRHIRVMLPMLKRAKIRHHSNIILKTVDRWIDENFNQVETHRDFLRKAQTLTMNVFGWIAFDYDFDSNLDRQLRKAFEDFSFYSTALFFIPWMPAWSIRFLLRLNWNYQYCRRNIQHLIDQIIDQEMKHQKQEQNHERPRNLIAAMLQSLNEQATDEDMTSGMKREEIVDEILVSILAGYETTSTALTWLTFYLSKNPAIQDRIRDELREHDLLVNDNIEELDEGKLDRLVYCDAVVKEALRFAPVASLTSRIALKDVTVEGVSVFRGQHILIPLACLNHDKRYWKYADPNEFVPERFLADDKIPQQFTYVPFGGGHRACIGQDLATLELKLILIRMMQRNLVIQDTKDNIGGYEEMITCYPKQMVVRIGTKELI